jgi:hypothetical protein
VTTHEVSDLCRDFLHHRCDDCPCRCHADEALFRDTATYGETYRIAPVYSRDLLGHLQSGREALPLDQAARVVQTLIDLGWRPTVAQLVRETDSGRRVSEPETVQVPEALL